MDINAILEAIDGAVWGVPLIVLIIACGVWLTFRVRFLQVRHLGKALKFMVKNEEGGEGEISSFSALCTALSATIGTGNIVGVATAMVSGGPGALVWNFSDIANALMAIPNLICMLILSKEVAQDIKAFQPEIDNRHTEKRSEQNTYVQDVK